MSPDWANPLQHMWLFGATSTHQSVDFLIDRGVAARVIPVSSGRISYKHSFISSQKCDSKKIEKNKTKLN